MRSLLKRFVLLATIGSLAFGCGDTEPSGDTVGTDTTASDTGTPGDTGTPADTNVPADTSGADTTVADTVVPPADTVQPDTSPPQDTTPAAKNCLDHLACVLAHCAGKIGADAAACLTDAGTVSACALGEDVEAAAAVSVAQCLSVPPCDIPADDTDKTWSKYYKCAGKNCVEQAATCMQGAGQAGTSDCEDLRACVLQCEPDFLTGKASNGCLRVCATGATTDAAKLYVDLEYCILVQCWDAQDYSICVQQSVGTYCPNEYDLCYGTQN